MRIHRAIHVDFHTLPNIYDFGERYDAQIFAKCLKQANVTCINLVASCNLGFCYYPTKIGVPYPYMKGDRFGETLRVCKAEGLGVFAYLNIGLNHENAYLHEDWCRADEKGRKIYGDTTGNFFRMMCYNSDGFRAYFLSLVRELTEKYEVDGFFFDGLKINPCYCEKCLSDLKRRGQGRVSSKIATEFTHQNLLSLCKEIKGIIGEKEVFFCGLPLTDGLSTHLEVECLPSGEWGYDYFHQASAYARNFTDNPVYMTGRFQADWGDFGGIKTQASFEYDLFDALSNGCTISFGDHLHPAENLDKELYERIGKVYALSRRYEKHVLDGKYVAEIGVLNDGDIFALSDKKFVGVARILNELKYAYNLITAESDFEKYRLLILPDNYLLDKKTAKKIANYLKKSGKILSTGTSALNKRKSGFALTEYNFLQFCKVEEDNYPYFQFTDERGSKWAEYRSGIVMKKLDGKEYADYIQPYNKRYYDGRHGYFYTPPEKKTGFSSAVGVGNIAHISFQIFTAYAEYFLTAHRTLLEKILQDLLPDPLLKRGTLPYTARATVTETLNEVCLHIRTDYPEWKNGKGVVEEHILQSAGKEIYLKGSYEAFFDGDTDEKIPVEQVGDYTKICLPEIVGYKLLYSLKKS